LILLDIYIIIIVGVFYLKKGTVLIMNDLTNKTNQLNSIGVKDVKSDEINVLPLLMVLLKKLWLIILAAVIVGGATFAGTKFLITPTYRCSFTAYVNNKSQLSNGQDTLSSSDITAAQQLVRAYSEIVHSRAILQSAAEKINLDLSADELNNMVSTEVQNDTQIITVYVVDTTPEGAYNLAQSIALISPDQISNVIEGSSMRIIDMPQRPTKIYKPSLMKNTLVGCLLGAFIAVVYIIIRLLLNDKVKDESDLEARFSLPVVGVIPDMNTTSKGDSNYYDYEYAYRNSEIKRSGDRNGK
jgi:capsular polysaccharide biosynthesis protein